MKEFDHNSPPPTVTLTHIASSDSYAVCTMRNGSCTYAFIFDRLEDAESIYNLECRLNPDALTSNNLPASNESSLLPQSR